MCYIIVIRIIRHHVHFCYLANFVHVYIVDCILCCNTCCIIFSSEYNSATESALQCTKYVVIRMFLLFQHYLH